MKFSSFPKRRFTPCVIAAIVGLASLPGMAIAGVVTGRVYNPATGEYVRNARIEIKETGQVTTSGDGGEYRMVNVSAGSTVVTVTYAGYRTDAATVEVTEEGTVTQDFEIISTDASAMSSDGVVQLEKFVTSASREGNAKAIQEQRNSMDVTNTIATDVFGEFPEGNVAEFLRYLPGIQLDGSFGEPRYVKLRGMGPEYNSVTVDGMPMAGADANNGANGRAFSFEMASLTSMDSVEVSKTISADVDANAPAGTINMRTKRAFDRKGRRIAVTATAAMHDSAQSLGKSVGPRDDGESHKVRLGGSIEFSDVFMNRRLGVFFNVSQSNIYEESSRFTHNYNYNLTNARQAVMNTIALMSAPRFYERNTASLTVDFKATPTFAMGVKLVKFDSDLYTPQRTVTVTAGTRANVTGDGLTEFTTASNSKIASANNYVRKLGESLVISPTFDWKIGDLAIEGRFSMTDAESRYDNALDGTLRAASGVEVTGTRYDVRRSSVTSSDWQITQISGPDISNPASLSNGTLYVDDGRSASQKFYTGLVNATLPTRIAGTPVVFKAGVKHNVELRNYDNTRELYGYTYNGGAGYWTDRQSNFTFNDTFNGGKITSISGGGIAMPHVTAAYRDFLNNPNSYTHNFTADSAYTAWVENRSRFEEEISAAYLMATAQLNKRASLRGGVRWEGTTNKVKEFDPYTVAEVRAAGYAVNSATDRATTVEGIQYQFLSRPMKTRKSSYDNLFPSASFKYELPWDIDMSLGYSSTIRRAPYSMLAGVKLVNDEALRVKMPNAGLEPESADNFALRFARYSKSLGMISVSFFENQIKNLFLETTLTAEEFGNTDPALAGYDFNTTINSDKDSTMRGFEFQFSQNLGFLTDHLKRFTVTGSYTRNYLRKETITDLVPHMINGGVNYTWNRFNVYVNASWNDDAFNAISATNVRWDVARTYVSAGGSIKLSKNLTASVSVRNLTDTPEYKRMEQRENLQPVLQLYQSNGTTYTFMVKALF
jgi:iron complex outermembrane receptor protein